MTVTIKVKSGAAEALLRGISQRCKDAYAANQRIAQMMRDDVLRHFATQDGGGEQWADLKPASWKYKRKRGYYQILQNSGMLRRRNLPEATKTTAIVYNDLSYARGHQKGDRSRNLPARPFLWLSELSLKRIVSFMKNYLVRNSLGGVS